MTKTCSKCQQQRPVGEFYPREVAKDGLTSWCKRCYADRNAEYRRANAAHFQEYERRPDRVAKQRERSLAFIERVAAIKIESGCVDCGYNDHAVALDFDHLPGTEKSYTVSKMTSRRWETVAAEIAKCEVVCANCHRVRTHSRHHPTIVSPS